VLSVVLPLIVAQDDVTTQVEVDAGESKNCEFAQLFEEEMVDCRSGDGTQMSVVREEKSLVPDMSTAPQRLSGDAEPR
jgi:hypothetical protein